MKRKKVAFDAEELVRAVEDVADHVAGKRVMPLRVTHVAQPPRVEKRPTAARATKMTGRLT